MEIWQEGICWKVYPYHRRRHYDNLDYLLHQHLIKISVNTDQSPKDVLPCLCGSWRERCWEQCFNIHLIEISISHACFCFYPVSPKPTKIPADSGRCGICLVFRVSPGTWRVKCFFSKVFVTSYWFLTRLIGRMSQAFLNSESLGAASRAGYITQNNYQLRITDNHFWGSTV